MQIKEKIKHT